MAEGFDSPYHVPQQSRRDKLRVAGCVDNLHPCAGLLPLYDPSLISSSDLLTCANFHQHNSQNPPPENSKTNPNCIKEERMNLMGYISSSSSSTSHHLYMDPQSSLHINPSSIHDLNNPFLLSPQNLRVLDQSFNNNGSGVLSSGQGLSLSLSSQQTHENNSVPSPLNQLQRYDQQPYDLSRTAVPLGPFTGYASILKGSRFLKPAQQMLEELCDVGCGINYAEKITGESTLLDPPPSLDSLSRNEVPDDDPRSSGEHRRKKSKLLSMLDEVYRRYKQYYQQMQAVVASFESVAGLNNAAPFANLALRAMSKHFRYLKNAITDQLQFAIKSYGQINYGKDEIPRAGNSDRSFGQKCIQNIGFTEHQPVWRPQRGLPERAVIVLRAWLFEHFLHPYPTDTDKLMLAKQTGLSRNQVSNWFINARVRLWKPMVEEIHTLETRQGQKPSQREEQNADRINDHLPAANSHASQNPSTSTQRVQDLSSKRARDDYSNNLMAGEEPMNLLYGNTSNHPHMGIGMNGVVGSGGVSLTLGLHQNNGMGISEPFAMNAARRFGLDASNDGFVMGTFETQNRQFGRDFIGGQLLHDFVG